MNLPQLTKEQLHAIDVATNLKSTHHPTAISGPAGSGKTLVTINAAKRLTSQSTLSLFDDQPNNSVYFVTYTKQLKEYVSSQLPNEAKSNITVLTVHSYLMKFLKDNSLSSNRYCFVGDSKAEQRGALKRRAFIKKYIDENKEQLALTGCLTRDDFLDEEIGWLLGRGIRNLQSYRDVPRTGRHTRLSLEQREKVFTIFKAYMVSLVNAGGSKLKILDFDDIGNQVLNLCENQNYSPLAKHLIVDEVQDLPLTWIEALRKTASDKIIVAGDTSQSIYGRGFTWQELAGRRIKPIRLTEDFRSTQQIYLAARSLMDFDSNPETDIGKQGQKRRNGDKPKLVFCSEPLAQFEKIQEIVTHLRASDAKCTIAIGFPKRNEYFNRLHDTYQDIIVTTLHSLKGLEAEHVILADLDEDVFDFSNEFTQEDTNRHLLYVGMTRATKSLTMLTATSQPSRTLYELSADYIELDESENPKAHQALIDIRTSQARKARRSFDTLAKNKAESEELVDQVLQNIETASTHSPIEGNCDDYIADLEEELRKAKARVAKTTEMFQRQEDELRVYRAREKSDSVLSAQPTTNKAHFVDDAKILILGTSTGVKPKDLPAIFKSMDLPRDAFEAYDYDEIHDGKFDTRSLLGSVKYSDIFISTTPHKAKGIGDASSLVEYLQSNKSDLPKLTVFRNPDGTLKPMSKTDLKIALTQSDLYAAKKELISTEQ